MIDFNARNDVKRSWELKIPSGETIESCLSPKWMIHKWNLSQRKKVETLDQLSQNQNAKTIFEKATEAFSFLIQNRTQFFKANHAKIEKIVIGQRLGIFMANTKLISLDLYRCGKWIGVTITLIEWISESIWTFP